jgi:integrase/recombinase XerD
MAKRLMLNNSFSPIGNETEIKATYFTVQDFIDKEKDFLIYKRSQNLAPRSLYDYDRCFLYMNNYVNEVYLPLTHFGRHDKLVLY